MSTRPYCEDCDREGWRYPALYRWRWKRNAYVCDKHFRVRNSRRLIVAEGKRRGLLARLKEIIV